MQKVSTATPGIGNAFMSKMKPTFFTGKGKSQAFSLFKEVYSKVPAYKKFLEDKGFDVTNITNINDFKKLPLIDKENYLKKYSLKERCLNGELNKCYAISFSSGASGVPTYWPRIPETDANIPKVMDMLLYDIIEPKKYSTLIVNTLAMGLWSAGDMCTIGCREMAKKKDYRITVALPGLKIKETLTLIKDIGHEYDQILMIGYPPFVKDIIDEADEFGLDWKEFNLKIMIGGEGISEEWRDLIMEKIGAKRINDITSLFATSDAGIVGFETPLSILTRKLILKNSSLKKKLIGNVNDISLVQYNPMAKYIEIVDGEIILSSFGAVPLLRYNIHDKGKVIDYLELLKAFEDENIDIVAEMGKYGFDLKHAYKLPFFVAFGRSDGIHFYAVNIYRENIMIAVNNSELSQYVTGKFKVGVIEDSKSNQSLEIKIELNKNVKTTPDIERKLTKIIQNEICKTNSEYRELSLYIQNKNGEPYFPNIEYCRFGSGEYFSNYDIKHKYFM